MRLLRAFLGLALLFSFSATVLAQVSAIPACAQLCLLKTLKAQDECGITDQACICQNKHIAANVTACVTGSCTIRETLTYANISKATCGVPDGDRSFGPIYPVMVLIICTSILVCLRMWARSISAGFWWDDWVIFVTWIILVPWCINGIIMGYIGLGKHVWDISFTNLSRINKMYYWGEWTYLVIAAGYKIGILLFLLRIFPEKRFRVVVWCLIVFNAAWGVASVAMTIFQCWPIRKAWDWEQKVEGRCNDKHAQAWTAAAMGIVLDLVILLLPIPSLIKLQLSGKKKLGLLGMFSCGILITIASVIRLQTLVTFGNSQDKTWDQTPASYWTAIEMNVGVSVSCMPALRPLLQGAFPKLNTFFSTAKGSTNNTSGTAGTIDRMKQRQGALKMEEGSVKHTSHNGTIDTKSESTVVELSRMETRPNTSAGNDGWDAHSSQVMLDRKDNMV